MQLNILTCCDEYLFDITVNRHVAQQQLILHHKEVFI